MSVRAIRGDACPQPELEQDLRTIPQTNGCGPAPENQLRLTGPTASAEYPRRRGPHIGPTEVLLEGFGFTGERPGFGPGLIASGGPR